MTPWNVSLAVLASQVSQSRTSSLNFAMRSSVIALKACSSNEHPLRNLRASKPSSSLISSSGYSYVMFNWKKLGSEMEFSSESSCITDWFGSNWNPTGNSVALSRCYSASRGDLTFSDELILEADLGESVNWLFFFIGVLIYFWNSNSDVSVFYVLARWYRVAFFDIESIIFSDLLNAYRLVSAVEACPAFVNYFRIRLKHVSREMKLVKTTSSELFRTKRIEFGKTIMWFSFLIWEIVS